MACRRILEAKYKLGLFENPYLRLGSQPVDREKYRSLALEAARKSIVLLKNDRNVLPLEKDAKAELNEYQKALKESKRKYEKTVNGVFDSDFWCAFAFRDREECEEFLKELGFNPKEKYFNGRDLLKKIRSMTKM